MTYVNPASHFADMLYSPPQPLQNNPDPLLGLLVFPVCPVGILHNLL